jgi:hypothetical protein
MILFCKKLNGVVIKETECVNCVEKQSCEFEKNFDNEKQ